MNQRFVKSCLRLGRVNSDVIERAVSSILEWDFVVVIGERDERCGSGSDVLCMVGMLWVETRGGAKSPNNT